MDFEHESPEDGGTASHLVSGAMAGMAEHVAMYPVDTIKTRMQVFSTAPSSERPLGVLGMARAIVRHEGVLRLLHGAPVVALGAAPAHALYFAVYERAKRAYSAAAPAGSIWETVSFSAAGATATMAADAIMTPAETIKQRLQVKGSRYASILHCAGDVLRSEGLRAFFRSYPTTLMMNVPTAGVHFAVYEYTSRFLVPVFESPLPGQLCAGAFAGAVAAAVTTPLDVAKTRLQTQGAGGDVSVRYTGLVQTLKAVVSESGLRGLSLGLVPRVLFFAPAGAIAWATYETMKRLTRHWSDAI
eukprot:Amastigsp_a843071_62.p1 type:complete len:301 gc:universal Amastigsp_a843071_62:44-946(+)